MQGLCLKLGVFTALVIGAAPRPALGAFIILNANAPSPSGTASISLNSLAEGTAGDTQTIGGAGDTSLNLAASLPSVTAGTTFSVSLPNLVGSTLSGISDSFISGTDDSDFSHGVSNSFAFDFTVDVTQAITFDVFADNIGGGISESDLSVIGPGVAFTIRATDTTTPQQRTETFTAGSIYRLEVFTLLAFRRGFGVFGDAGPGVSGHWEFRAASNVSAASAVPEPSTLALAGLVGIGLIGVVRRRKG